MVDRGIVDRIGRGIAGPMKCRIRELSHSGKVAVQRLRCWKPREPPFAQMQRMMQKAARSRCIDHESGPQCDLLPVAPAFQHNSAALVGEFM